MNKAELHTGIDLEQWEVTNPVASDQYYNCDAVIEAYVKGEKDGLKNEQKVIFKQFTENVEKSKTVIADFLKLIMGLGFVAKSAYLKFEFFDTFECVIAIHQDDFIKEDFLAVYNLASKTQNDFKSDLFNINFSFMPFESEDFEDSIRHDGFIYRFRKN